MTPETFPMTDRSKSLYIVISALVMLLAALAVEVYMVRLYLAKQAVAFWPATEGEILHSEVADRIPSGFEASIRYRYTVNNQTYESNRVSPTGEIGTLRTHVSPFVSNYPVGKRVLIHYNPAKPQDSYLIVGADFKDYALIIAPIVYAAAMIYLAYAHFYLWLGARSADDDQRERFSGIVPEAPRS